MGVPSERVRSDSTQMNIRIGKTLKERGDRVLFRAGYTPSQAVRALYEFAIQHEAEPETIAAMLTDGRDDGSDRQAAHQEARLEALRGIDRLVDEQRALLGISFALGSDDRSFDELREVAMTAHFEEKGLL